nr:MAG TPA: hypothetical protein [Caudoviricetes sp.]
MTASKSRDKNIYHIYANRIKITQARPRNWNVL